MKNKFDILYNLLLENLNTTDIKQIKQQTESYVSNLKQIEKVNDILNKQDKQLESHLVNNINDLVRQQLNVQFSANLINFLNSRNITDNQTIKYFLLLAKNHYNDIEKLISLDNNSLLNADNIFGKPVLDIVSQKYDISVNFIKQICEYTGKKNDAAIRTGIAIFSIIY